VDDALGNVAKRRGIRKAIVALGRRLAVLMHRIWSDGTEFRWTKDPLMQPSI
jgi:transposase